MSRDKEIETLAVLMLPPSMDRVVAENIIEKLNYSDSAYIGKINSKFINGESEVRYNIYIQGNASKNSRQFTTILREQISGMFQRPLQIWYNQNLNYCVIGPPVVKRYVPFE